MLQTVFGPKTAIQLSFCLHFIGSHCEALVEEGRKLKGQVLDVWVLIEEYKVVMMKKLSINFILR